MREGGRCARTGRTDRPHHPGAGTRRATCPPLPQISGFSPSRGPRHERACLVRLDSTPLGPRPAASRRAGAKAVLVEADDYALPFEIVTAKIRAPESAPGAISRTALVNRLRADRSPRVISVVAPGRLWQDPLLAQWAARDDRRFAWLSLDRRDNDPVVLLRHISAAMDEVSPVDARRSRCAGKPGGIDLDPRRSERRRNGRSRRALRPRSGRRPHDLERGLRRGAGRSRRPHPRGLRPGRLEPGRLFAGGQHARRRQAHGARSRRSRPHATRSRAASEGCRTAALR